ncbi:MAG: phospholipase [Persephonella sp.]|nr:MAG: phospholipase [Persephonella sp.]
MRWIYTGKRQRGLILKNLILDEQSEIYQNLKKNINKDFIANLGHSTFLIQLNGKRILTDPFLSPHIMGIKRKIPALSPNLVPKPDLILISHSHYDHLDLKTLKEFDRDIPIIVSERSSPILKNIKFKVVIEIPHFKILNFDGIEITALPVQHTKGRSLLYPNTETNSYIVKINGITLYFGGDTGYFEGFKKYGRDYKLDFAFLPIGGFEPRILLKKVHMNPEEAVEAFKDLKAKYLVPIHFDTFHTIPSNLKREKAVERLKKKLEMESMLERGFIVKPNELRLVN